MKQKIQYEDVCDLYNETNNQTIQAEILDFFPEIKLVVSVNRSVKVILHYDHKTKNYVSFMAGYSFVSDGPAKLISYNGRKL